MLNVKNFKNRIEKTRKQNLLSQLKPDFSKDPTIKNRFYFFQIGPFFY